jgi:hypothetical protein
MSNFIKILKTSNLCLVPVSVLSGLVNMNNNDTTFRTFIEFAPTKNVVSIVNNVKYDSFCYHNGQRFINSAFKTPIEFHQSFKKIYFDIGHSNSFTKNMFSNVSQSRFNIAKQALLTNKILASCFGIYKGLNRLLFHPKEDVIE